MRRITLLSIAAALTAGLGACTDAGRSLIILQNQVPDANCVVPSSQGNTFRGVGFLDVNSPAGYLFTPLVQNVAEGVADDPSGRLVLMRGADVELEFQDGFPAPDHPDVQLTHRFSGSINPNGGTAGFAFNAISANMTEALKATGALDTSGSNSTTVIAHITASGDIDGGSVESREFEYPIQVCDGCLVRSVGSCDQLATDFEAEQGFSCFGFYQDALLDCCTDSTGQEVCPAVSTML